MLYTLTLGFFSWSPHLGSQCAQLSHRLVLSTKQRCVLDQIKKLNLELKSNPSNQFYLNTWAEFTDTHTQSWPSKKCEQSKAVIEVNFSVLDALLSFIIVFLYSLAPCFMPHTSSFQYPIEMSNELSNDQ